MISASMNSKAHFMGFFYYYVLAVNICKIKKALYKAILFIILFIKLIYKPIYNYYIYCCLLIIYVINFI